MLLTATVTGCLALFYASEVTRDEGRRRALLVGFYLLVGASLLAKGLVGVVIPGGVAAVYFLLRRRLSGIFRMGLLWGVPLALLIAATWYAPVLARHGRVFFDEFIVRQHFSRFVSNRYHHPQPFYFYLPVTLILTLPWTAFLVGGIWGAGSVNPRAEDAASKLRVLALAWLVVPIVFFSASGSKLPGYVLPAIPGAAVLAGDCLHRYLSGRGGLLAMRLTGVLALLFAAACVVFCFYNVGEVGALAREVPKPCAVALIVPACVLGLVAILLGLCVGAKSYVSPQPARIPTAWPGRGSRAALSRRSAAPPFGVGSARTRCVHGAIARGCSHAIRDLPARPGLRRVSR